MKISQGWRICYTHVVLINICRNGLFEISKPSPSVTIPSTMSHLQSFQIVPLLDNQGFTFWVSVVHSHQNCPQKSHSSWFVTTPRTVFSSVNCLFILDGHRKIIRLWTFEPKVLWSQFLNQQPFDSLSFERTSKFLFQHIRQKPGVVPHGKTMCDVGFTGKIQGPWDYNK